MEPGDVGSGDELDSRRINRRTLIQRAAAVGAAAWVAPVIVDSLASPAAAASGCPPFGACTNFYAYKSDSGVGPCVDLNSNNNKCSGTLPPSFTTCPPAPHNATVTLVGGTVVVSLPSGCQLTAGGAFAGNNCCSFTFNKATCNYEAIANCAGHDLSHIDFVYCCPT